MTRSIFIMLLAACCAACGDSNIEVINDTSIDADPAEVIAMAERVCPICDDLRIKLVESTSTGGAEHEYGPGRKPEIRIIYTGCLVDDSLPHELIHWRLHQLAGEDDTTHEWIDWHLIPVLNHEFSCR